MTFVFPQAAFIHDILCVSRKNRAIRIRESIVACSRYDNIGIKPKETTMTLSEEQTTQFEKDGYLVVEGLLTEEEIATLRQRTEDIAEGIIAFPDSKLEFEPGFSDQQNKIANLRKINAPAQHDDFFVKHAQNPAILNAIESLLGPNIKLFSDQLFVKPPGGSEKTYHQDSPYFKIEPMALVTAWVALDDVTLDNGCMYVIPGSQQKGPFDHSEPWNVGDRIDMRIPDKVVAENVAVRKEESITMKSGGCSFHHSLIMHRSGPNNTSHFRRGLATHYMSSQSKWTGEPVDKPDYLLLRGVEFPGCV